MKKVSDYGPNTQLVVFLVSKVGIKDATKVGTFIVQWGTVARKLRREPTWPEYCAYWKESRATYYRALRLYRKVWPEDENPQRVWNWVQDQVPAKSSTEEAVTALFLSVGAT